MKCILHIGTEKTGTTILQDWLYDNKVELSKVGVYLSDNLGKTNNILIPAFFKEKITNWDKDNNILTQYEKQKYFDGFLEKLSNEILTAKNSHKVFVITSEHFSSMLQNQDEIKHLHTFLKSVFDEVEVVCYFRDQFDLAVSLYSTALKHHSSAELTSFIDKATPENYYYNYLQIADNWAEVFGFRNCKFKIYDRAEFINNDIRLDLMSVIFKDIDITKLKMDRVQSNKSLYLLQSIAFKVINRNIPYRTNDKDIFNKENFVAKEKIKNIESLKLGKITYKNSELIKNRFTKLNKIFFKKYFSNKKKFPISKDNDQFRITQHQVTNAIEDALEFGLKLNANISLTLSDEEINLLRDIAVHLYKLNPRSAEDALNLMKIAHRLRPDGKNIKNKVEQWSAQLNASHDK